MKPKFKTGDTVFSRKDAEVTGKARQLMTIAVDHVGVDYFGSRFFNGTYRCIWTDETGQKKTKIYNENELGISNARAMAKV
ncbi:MAG TPA: hypothetical protein VK155_05385 [Bacteroidales bacterium]|jgi:uncharacterized protein YodC (DUF2158 family)|nr:hypothetical protein [Bacteroidales bacterium]